MTQFLSQSDSLRWLLRVANVFSVTPLELGVRIFNKYLFGFWTTTHRVRRSKMQIGTSPLHKCVGLKTMGTDCWCNHFSEILRTDLLTVIDNAVQVDSCSTDGFWCVEEKQWLILWNVASIPWLILLKLGLSCIDWLYSIEIRDRWISKVTLSCVDRLCWYSSTCHRGPPLVQGKSDLSWQVTLRDRDRKWHQTHT